MCVRTSHPRSGKGNQGNYNAHLFASKRHVDRFSLFQGLQIDAGRYFTSEVINYFHFEEMPGLVTNKIFELMRLPKEVNFMAMK